MTTVTLRRWGGAIAISLPKKVLALLELEAGAEVSVAIEDGKVVLAPVKPRLSLTQLLKEQADLERRLAPGSLDRDWLDDPRRGRELL